MALAIDYLHLQVDLEHLRHVVLATVDELLLDVDYNFKKLISNDMYIDNVIAVEITLQESDNTITPQGDIFFHVDSAQILCDVPLLTQINQRLDNW